VASRKLSGLAAELKTDSSGFHPRVYCAAAGIKTGGIMDWLNASVLTSIVLQSAT
jgi:hypothetical protein